MATETIISTDEFLNKTTLLLGESETGKTIMTNHIIYEIKPYISAIYVICPTNDIKHDYDDIAPPNAIFEKLDRNWLVGINDRQTAAASIYETANNKETLLSLFNRVSNNVDKENLTKLQNGFNALREKCKNDNDKQELKDTHDRKITEYIKKVIHNNKKELAKYELTEKETYSLEYLYFSPHVLFIFDDCSSDMVQYMGGRTPDPLFQDIFYRCRHKLMTLLFNFHDITNISPNYCKSAFNVIMTTEIMTNSFFNRAQNQFAADEKREARKAVINIFTKSNKINNIHKKLCYQRQSAEPYKWIMATKHEKQQVGSKYFWELYGKCKRSNNQVLDPQNVFASRFKLNK